MVAGYESFEYDRLVERGFKPYSKGHRRMYESAIERMGRIAGPRGARVFEAGFGIGWGLGAMLDADVLREYEGCEPNVDSFAYTAKTFADHERASSLTLFNSAFRLPLSGGSRSFDFAVCIEVIEHVPAGGHLAFLRDLRLMAPTLFFSTPDKTRVPREGVRTYLDWLGLLAQAGFPSVECDRSNWTDLYVCQ